MNKQEILENLYPLIDPVEKKIEQMATTREEFDSLCRILVGHFLHAITHDKDMDSREKEYFFIRTVDDSRIMRKELQ